MLVLFSIGKLGMKSGGGASAYLGCSNCIELGHYVVACKSAVLAS